VYDENAKSLVSEMRGGNGITSAGHANRVFVVRWHPTDPNIVLSGGWDNTLLLSKNVMYTPHVSVQMANLLVSVAVEPMRPRSLKRPLVK